MREHVLAKPSQTREISIAKGLAVLFKIELMPFEAPFVSITDWVELNLTT